MKKSRSIRSVILAASLLSQLIAAFFDAHAAPGDVDLSFDPGSGVNGLVRAVALQSDGKVIIAGDFTTVKGLQRLEVARLNADGSGDSSFDPTLSLAGLSNPDWAVYSVALQTDGKVLIGGHFIAGGFNGIARLNPDGSLDATFNPAANRTGSFPILVQPDGKVLIGGSGISRLNTNGTLDMTFDSTAAGFGSVACLALQSDGRILAGGTAGDGYLVRRNPNGTLDNSFNPGTGANSGIRSVAVQSDGKVLIGGSFTSVNGTNRPGIARLNADGSLDGSFDPGAGVNSLNPLVNSIAVQSDGKLLIGGSFLTANNTNRTSIARLNANGSLDSAFNPALGSEVNSVVLQSDGKVLVGGYFSKAFGASRNRIARYHAGGDLDGSFDPGQGIESVFTSVVMQPDGKVLIGGALTFVSGTNRTGSLRLNANGSLDGTFVSDTNFDPGFGVKNYTPHPGGDIHYSIAYPTAATVQADGKVLVGVRSEYWQCDAFEGGCSVSTTYSVARLHADGSSDSSFIFTNVVNNAALLGLVSSIAVQSDGKIVVASSAFNTVRIARLDADGGWDNSFDPGSGPNGGVNAVASQPDGKILIGGTFSVVNSTDRICLARLNADGSLDDSFNPGSGANGPISSVVLEPDGKVLISGDFTTVNGTNRNRIARLDADGSLDVSFDPGTGADGMVRCIALQPDGNVVLSGDFLTVNGALRPHVARLYGDAVPTLNLVRSAESMIISWPATGLDFQLHETTNLAFPNSWSPVTQAAVTNSGRIAVTVPTSTGSKFFRLNSQ